MYSLCIWGQGCKSAYSLSESEGCAQTVCLAAVWLGCDWSLYPDWVCMGSGMCLAAVCVWDESGVCIQTVDLQYLVSVL